MRRVVGCLLLCLAATAPLWAARVKGEKAYQPYDKIVLEATDSSDKAQFLWDMSGDAQIEEAGRKLYVWAKPGKYVVRLTAVDFDAKKIERATFSFTVAGEVPPTPPDPPAPPKPPTPPPSPAPIPAEGFRVLVVYETAELSKLPAAQSNVLYAKSVRDYLNAKCVMGPDSKTREWRIYDADVDTSAETKLWQDAMKVKRDKLPWLIVSNGKTGYSGPLPENVEKTLELLKKYAEDK